MNGFQIDLGFKHGYCLLELFLSSVISIKDYGGWALPTASRAIFHKAIAAAV
jgi:hypothetical protein